MHSLIGTELALLCCFYIRGVSAEGGRDKKGKRKKTLLIAFFSRVWWKDKQLLHVSMLNTWLQLQEVNEQEAAWISWNVSSSSEACWLTGYISFVKSVQKNNKLRLFFCFQQSCNVGRIRRTGKAPVISLWECSWSCSGPCCHMICLYDLLLTFQLLTSETRHQQTACSSFKMANLYDERTWSAEMQTYLWKLRSCSCICIGLNKWDITCPDKTVCEYSPDCQIISLKVQYVWIWRLLNMYSKPAYQQGNR